MTRRERLFLIGGLGLAGLILVGGLLWFGLTVLGSISEKDDEILQLQRKLGEQQLQLTSLAKKKLEYENYRSIALPPDRVTATKRYSALLQEMLVKHGLVLVNPITSEGGNATNRGAAVQLITPIAFSTTIEGKFGQFLSFLGDFYSVNVPHAIRNVGMTPLGVGADARLSIFLRIQALSLTTAIARDFVPALPEDVPLKYDLLMGLMQQPNVGLASALATRANNGFYARPKLALHYGKNRDYSALIQRNAFAGLKLKEDEALPPPPLPPPDQDVLKFVQLTSITESVIKTEASLRNRLTGEFTSLRDEGGLNTFTIKDARDQVVVRGRVLAITRKEVICQVEDKAYAIRIGEFLSDALNKPLPPEKLKTYDVELIKTALIP